MRAMRGLTAITAAECCMETGSVMAVTIAAKMQIPVRTVMRHGTAVIVESVSIMKMTSAKTAANVLITAAVTAITAVKTAEKSQMSFAKGAGKSAANVQATKYALIAANTARSVLKA